MRFRTASPLAGRVGVWILLVALISGCLHRPAEKPLFDIVVGSCLNKTDHPMLNRTLELPMDLFVYMGDNIYGDSSNRLVLREKYRALKESRFHKALQARVPVLATWDDHDYGLNDGGAENPIRAESQAEFLDWIGDPAGSIRRRRPGVYDGKIFGPPGRRVQILLLDTRYFRSPLKKGAHGMEPSGGPYVPHPDPEATMLGNDQWRWLEGELRRPAELRLVISSIQFVAEFCGSEAWANLPFEKERMLQLIAKTGARGLVFLSGDRHWCELSRMDGPNGLPLFDLTVSAMTQGHARGTPTPNRFRFLPKTVHQPNAGLIHIDWDAPEPSVKLQVIDESGVPALEHSISFRELGR